MIDSKFPPMTLKKMHVNLTGR